MTEFKLRPSCIDAFNNSMNQQDKRSFGLSMIGYDIQQIYMDYQHKNELIDIPVKNRMIMSAGHFYEEIVKEHLKGLGFTLLREQESLRTGVLINNEEIIGHIDGTLTKGTERLLEIKSLGYLSLERFKELNLSDSHPGYYDQVQIYMHFTGLKECEFIAISRNDLTIETKIIGYNEEHGSLLFNKLLKIKQYVETGIMPELEYPNVCEIELTKVRNKEEYKASGNVLIQTHVRNKYNPYLIQDKKVIFQESLRNELFPSRPQFLCYDTAFETLIKQNEDIFSN